MRRLAVAALLLVPLGPAAVVPLVAQAREPSRGDPRTASEEAPEREPRQAPEEEPAPEILGAPSAMDGGAFDEARIPVPAGTPLRQSPGPRAPILAVIHADSELPELERRGDWVRVRYLDSKGWVPAPGSDAGGEPAARSVPARFAEPTAPDPELLARARGLLKDRGTEHPLGPWTLYTDVDDPGLLQSLDRLAAATVEAYRDRYGLDPGIDSGRGPTDGSEETAETEGGRKEREAVVLFAREEAHRELLGEESEIAALGAEGHAGAGLVALHRKGGDEKGVRSLLVHELVHLLNRRSLGARTPAWLEEGAAHALASSRIDPSGRLHPELLGGERRTVDRRRVGTSIQVTVETKGALAGLDRVVEALGRGALDPLERLTSRTWREMVDPSKRELRYAQSALFVRFLLDGDRGRWRDGFRSYLAAVAAGDPGKPARLLEALDTEWGTLEPAFRRWLRFRQARSEMRLEPG